MRTLLAATFLLTALRPAVAQCRLSTESAFWGTGAVGSGRALLTDWHPQLPPHVHFYEKTGQGWQLDETFEIGDFRFFHALPVAIDGDRAVAGAPEARSLGGLDLAGRAYVFDRIGDHWVQTELFSGTLWHYDAFGNSVDVSGDVAVVGASHPLPFGDQLGRVHVFEFDGTNWNEVAQLMTYGDSIDVDGDTIVVGDDRIFPGHVDVIRKESGLWTWTDRITVQTPPEGPRLGNAVALRGDTLIVGAVIGHPLPGQVKVFRRQAGGGWQQIQDIVPSVRAPQDWFGSSLALSGSTLLVGAPHVGLVFRFEEVGGSFVEVGIIEPDHEPADDFGEHVALHREDAILAGDVSVSIFRLGFASQTSFCPTTPNSTGSPGSLAIEGCDSLGGQRLTLVADHLPAGVLGVGFFGASTAQLPYGDGFRCVGNPSFRFPGETSDATGHLVHEVDFSSGPASNLTSGQTWHFQTAYRDPASPGARFNLTNALSIGITP